MSVVPMRIERLRPYTSATTPVGTSNSSTDPSRNAPTSRSSKAPSLASWIAYTDARVSAVASDRLPRKDCARKTAAGRPRRDDTT